MGQRRSTIDDCPRADGESERSAARCGFSRTGLPVDRRFRILSSEYAPDAVIGQMLVPKSNAPRVALLVNRATGYTYVMPDLIGVNGDRGCICFGPARFGSQSLAITRIPAYPAGIVLRQNPQAGFQIAPGRADFARGQPVTVQDRRRPFSPRTSARSGRRRSPPRSAAARTSSTWTSWTATFVPNLTMGAAGRPVDPQGRARCPSTCTS